MPRSTPSSSRRDFPGRRWLIVGVRSLHLVGVVLVGAALLGGTQPAPAAGWLMLLTGLLLYGVELWSNPKHLGELAGLFIPAKLALVALMLWRTELAGLLFWTLLIASSVVSHAPGAFRHWRLRPWETEIRSKPPAD